MAYLDNRTPFASELLTLADVAGQHIQVLVIVATFQNNSAGILAPADPQPAVRLADEYFGNPESSSVRYEAETALSKPLVDVILNGTAYAPKQMPVSSMHVELHIGDIHKKLRIRGNCGRGWKIFKASEPFTSMPILYERAYGGTIGDGLAKQKVYRWNPVGIGFKGAQPRAKAINTTKPNIEYLASSLTYSRRSPAGFGIIARSWSPRLELAGTYDDEWLATQWPLLAKDFHPLHNQIAPGDQQSRQIVGGEDVRLVNLTVDGLWCFKLPILDVPVRLLYDHRQVEASPKLDTVLIEPDLRRVALSYRLNIPMRRMSSPLREIVLGHLESAWLRSKAKRKKYWDHRGLNGLDASKPCYHT